MNKILYALLLLGFALSLPAQDAPMRVERSDALEWGAPVRNVHVDADNRKWVSSTAGLFIVYDTDIAEPAGLAAGQQSLLQFPGGNADVRWSRAALTAAIGDILDRSNYISAAYYDEGKGEIWLGTSQTGLFRLRAEPLQLIEQLTTSSSKLRSNQINDLHADVRGRLWIATNDGVLMGQPGKWDVLEKNLVIESIAGYGDEVWFMGDGLLGPVNRRNVWSPISVPARKTEGSMRDIAFDAEGRLWIASEVITRYEPAASEFTVFGPAQEYTSQFATFLMADLDGTIWIGTEDKGLYRIGRGSGLVVDLRVVRPATCAREVRDGALKVRVAGGEPPYSYTWNASLSGDSPQNLQPGTYQVTVSDSKGQSKVAQAEIPDPRLTAAATQQQSAGPGGDPTGQATVSLEGGTPDFRYQWDNGENTPTATQLTAGPHTVTVTDANNCRATASVTISQEALPLNVAVSVASPVQCKGEQNATLRAEVSGGKGPYAYQWSLTSINKSELPGVGAGEYTVTVTDADNAQTVASIRVDDPVTLTATGKVVQPVTPGAADGQATVVVNGGEGIYTYRWDNGEATQEASGLSAGYHTVTVTDELGCEATSTFNVPEEVLPLQVSLQPANEIGCNGGLEASLTVAVNGGKSPYQYAWSDPTLKGGTAAGLGAGTYTLTVTDAAGQTQTAEAAISEPPALEAKAAVESPASTGGTDGQASVEASGGTPPYSYEWDTGERGAQATALPPGEHTVVITDAAGCETTATVEITEDILPLQVSLTQTEGIDCNGGASAALSAQVRGGKGPYEYAWSEAGLSGETGTGLRAGAYNLTVTDVTGQQQSAQVTISEPDALQAAGVVESPASTGGTDGSASARAQGGTGAYTYAWDNGEKSATATGLAPGRHAVTVTDENGCTATAEVEITEDILPLQVSLTQTEGIDCNGGASAALSAQVRGGKGPYEYAWSEAGLSGETGTGLRAGAYNLTVTDVTGQQQSAQVTISEPDALQAAGVVESPASTGGTDGSASARAQGGTGAYTYAWDNGENSATATGLAPGRHAVTVTDENGCTATAEVEITEDILPLQVSLAQTEGIDCNGGASAALSAQVRGGKGPYEYAWSEAGLSGETGTGLRAGAYNLTVTDVTGQQQSAQVTISEPDALQAAGVVESPASTGGTDGSASARAQGGTGAYTYAWDNGENSATATGLAPGRHAVTVTDENGCTATAEVEITEDILPLQVSLTQTEGIDCNGGASAALSAQVRGGKGPYEYAWSDAGLSGETGTGLRAGAYNLTVTDVTGQQQSAQVTVSEPDALQAAGVVESPASTGGTDGSASARAQGGTGAYTYAWDNGEKSATATGLAPGRHAVTVTDENGCTATAEVEITEDILPLQVSLAQTEGIDCNGGASAALSAQVRGGKGPYEYTWSDAGLSGETGTGLRAGAYSLTVTDVTGQQQSAQVTVSEPDALQAAGVVESPASTGGTDGSASARAQGGTGAYTYAWDNGEKSATATGLAPGRHAVTVTDENGCTATAEVEITEDILPLQVSLTQTEGIDCNGGSASLTAQVRGGKGPYEYTWSEAGLSGETAANLSAGEYGLTVSDVTGQTQAAQVRVSEPDPLVIAVEDARPASTEDTQDGQATVKATGGTGRYTYQWDNGTNTPEVGNLAVGVHGVTVTDENGCTAAAAFETVQKTIPELTAGRLRSGMTIQMQKLQFEADSTRITKDAQPILDEVFQFLKDNASIVVEIGGHTNNLPPAEYCDWLSTERAKAVAEYLVIKGIDPNRVAYKGYGKREPLFSNQTADGRRRNQRVEIKILRL